MSLENLIKEERYYASLPYTEKGQNNQRFSDVVNSVGLMGCQNQPWCATYQFALEIENFGIDEALKHWNMTRSTYRGYNVFETEAAFQKAGKTGSKPKVGALVIFRQSHMGRVLSINENTGHFECGEGNTSNHQFNRDGDSCAVKTYSFSDPKIKSFCYIDYNKKENTLTPYDLQKQCNSICNEARTRSWTYSDSKSLPPCNDNKISCDRMIARALWNLGYTDQPIGGITVVNMESYLTRWGFKKITNAHALKAGDIVLMAKDGESKPTWRWHTYLVDKINSNGTINKYDCGSQERLRTVQPFKGCAIDEWSNKHFYCAFRTPIENKQNDAKIEPGYYKIVSALGDNWVMDVNHGSVEKRANIQLYPDNGTDAQIFHLKRNTEVLWCICNKKSGKVFDIADGSKEKGGNLQQYPWNDTSAQKFYIKTTAKKGYYEIVNAGSGLALDVADGKAEKRRNIRQWRRNGTNAQMWKFVKV